MGEHLFDTKGTILDREVELPPVLSDAELEALTRVEQAAYDTEPDPDMYAGMHVGSRLDPSLFSWLPRPYLSIVLELIDREGLAPWDLVVLLKASARLRSMVDADTYKTINRIYRAEADLLGEHSETDAFDAASAEVGTALALTRRAADHETSIALDLADHPPVLDALTDGNIDYRRARTILSHLTGLDDETTSHLLDTILPKASGLTSGQLNHQLTRLAITLNPQAATDRYHQGIQERHLRANTLPDGTTTLTGDHLPTDKATSAAAHIHHLAQTLKTPDDPRTLDQIKADIYLDLLCGHTPKPHNTGNHDTPQHTGANVHVTVDLQTLSLLADHPGQLNTTPIIAEITRKTIAANHNGKWTYTVTHNGTPISTGTLNRRPTTAIKAHTQAAYPDCIFPGCRMPATTSDLDHRNPWTNHGPTSLPNLAPLCRHHHKLKHNGWKLTRNPDNTHTWTSPLGHTYTTGPDPP